jgi:hypothetical protein
LNIDKSATQNEIKKGYRKGALKVRKEEKINFSSTILTEIVVVDKSVLTR